MSVNAGSGLMATVGSVATSVNAGGGSMATSANVNLAVTSVNAGGGSTETLVNVDSATTSVNAEVLCEEGHDAETSVDASMTVEAMATTSYK